MATIMRNQANLSASTKTANLLAGSVFEFLSVPSRVTVSAISSAAGVNLQMMADNETVVDDQEILPIGTSLLFPDHVLSSFNARGGTRLSLFLRETAAAATTDVLLRIDVDPL